LDRLFQRRPVEAFAAQRYEQAATDVGVRAQGSEDPLGVIVRVTAREPDDLDGTTAVGTVAIGNFPGHVVGTLHEVDNE
jgi:hypothetical protein